MKIFYKYKTRFMLQTIKSILLTLLPYHMLKDSLIKELENHFNQADYNYYLTSSGRSALSLLLANLKKEEYPNVILLPDYICNAVFESSKYAGWDIRTYHTIDFKPCLISINEMIQDNEDCCILLASYLGRFNCYDETILNIKSVNPNCKIIFDQCQNFIGANKVKLDENSFIILSFNNKITPGLLGGAIISKRNDLNLKLKSTSSWEFIRFNFNVLLAYIKQNSKELFYAMKGVYPKPEPIEVSACKGKYDVKPYPIAKISLSAAYISIKNILFHSKVIKENNDRLNELNNRGALKIQGIPDMEYAKYIPVVLNSNTKYLFPLKGKYGLSDGCCNKEEAGYSFIISSVFGLEITE
jgi:hypothetical protein